MTSRASHHQPDTSTGAWYGSEVRGLVGPASYAPTMAPDPVETVEEMAEGVVATLRDDLTGSDGYLVVLLLTILSVIMIPIDDGFRVGPIITTLVLGLLVIVTLTRSQVGPWQRKIGLAVVTMSIVVATALVIDGRSATAAAARDHWLTAVAAASYCLVLALCFPAILMRAFSHRKVTLNTVAAALAAYLMLGLIFTSAFRFVNIVSPPFFAQTPVTPFTYEYFSYVTLTTVGYGDYTAASDPGRTLAMIEALMGQVFLVTIVAMVVSNLGQERKQLIRTATGSPTPTSTDPPNTA